jgi:ketosteroid isomerase-like protein
VSQDPVDVSQEPVEVVRRLIALGEQARKSGVTLLPTDLVAPDMEIDLSRRVFNPETYRGLEGWVRLNNELREVWAEWQVIPERIVAAGDRVVSFEAVRGRGRGSGLETEARYAAIWTFANGRVTRVELGLDPDEALKAVGLEE